MRSVRMPSTWEGFSKQVIAQSPFLTPRDVATIIHSFARVKYRDDKMLQTITSSVLKHIDQFSVREIVHIFSAFRKLEYNRLDSVDLLTNQLVLKANEWNPVDCALIANALGWFRVFDRSIWKEIEKHVTKNYADFDPLGISLVVGALAKLDMRNERILRSLSRSLTFGSSAGVVKQESFAIMVHAFYKLRWSKDHYLNLFFEDQLMRLLDETNFFDPQSLCLVLNAIGCYRDSATPEQTQIMLKGMIAVSAVLEQGEWKPSVDQLTRLDQVVQIARHRFSEFPELKCDIEELGIRISKLIEKKNRKRGHKLPRWEYEIYRILKDKMNVSSVRKRVVNGRTETIIQDADTVILCMGPFQYYADSTKRTAASKLHSELLLSEGMQVMEIPYFIWNELKTDQDKMLYLYSRGRQTASTSVENPSE